MKAEGIQVFTIKDASLSPHNLWIYSLGVTFTFWASICYAISPARLAPCLAHVKKPLFLDVQEKGFLS